MPSSITKMQLRTFQNMSTIHGCLPNYKSEVEVERDGHLEKIALYEDHKAKLIKNQQEKERLEQERQQMLEQQRQAQMQEQLRLQQEAHKRQMEQ